MLFPPLLPSFAPILTVPVFPLALYLVRERFLEPHRRQYPQLHDRELMECLVANGLVQAPAEGEESFLCPYPPGHSSFAFSSSSPFPY
jgi:hypothetical protein